MTGQSAGIETSVSAGDIDDDSISLLDLLIAMAESRWLLLLGPLLVGACAFGLTYFVTPVYTAKVVVLPPQMQQSAGAAVLQSLGSLAGLAGAAPGLRNPEDQYIALMQSNTVSDRLVAKHRLQDVYGQKSSKGVRVALASHVRFSAGKKDGLMVVEVDDVDPVRAAALANDYIQQLRQFTSELALTEAQQRRVFFERQLRDTRDKLAAAQKALQSSGINQGVIRAEPRAAAEAYAAIKAQVTAAEVQLQNLRGSMTDDAPEVRLMLRNLNALRSELNKAEAVDSSAASGEYVNKYREFKYQETLFDLLAKQYELAKLDESRDGSIIQVVDPATPPEHNSKPRRIMIGAVATVASGLLLLTFVLLRQAVRSIASKQENAKKIARLRAVFSGR